MVYLSGDTKTEDLFFRVEGMHCVKCIRKIQAVASKYKNLKNISVDLGEHLVTAHTASDFPVEEFMGNIRDQGFKIKSLPKNDSKNQIRKSQRDLLMRIGVAGFCAGNIMLLAAAEYVGAHIEEWPQIFSYLSFAFFIPVLTYSAWPLYESSWASIKVGKVSIDSPIILALFGGALLSTYHLIFVEGPVYFDSLSMFVFFLMASRFIVQKIQTKYVSGISTKDIFNQTRAILVDGQNTKPVNVGEVNVNDVIRVSQNSFVGFDGELESERALIDDALYTGEFLPKTKMRMDSVYAGTKNVGPSIDIKVTKTLENSRVSDLIRMLNQALQSKTPLQSLADKGAKWLTYAILAGATFIMIYFSFLNLEEGVNRVLALLVVACPCGLAIAAPLVQTLGVKRALRNNILIKNVEVLESLQALENTVFDKTGTLTLGEIRVSKTQPQDATEFEKDVIYNLEKNSEHPIALALRKYTGKRDSLDFKNFKEVIGEGVSGFFKGVEYSLTSDDTEESALVLRKNKKALLFIELEDKLNPEAEDLISFFAKKDIESFILSGDKRSRALSIGQNIGVVKNNIVYEKNPKEKEDFIKGKKNVLYVGDGVNDSLAMGRSLVSVSMKKSADIAFKASQVYIINNGLESLKSLLKISYLATKTIKTIILISLIYNVVFAFFAAFGFISPLIAVIIMPVSSILITMFGFYFMTKKTEGLV